MTDRLLIFAAGAACGSLMTACICSIVVRRLTRALALSTATIIAATSVGNAQIATPENQIRVIDGDTIARSGLKKTIDGRVIDRRTGEEVGGRRS